MARMRELKPSFFTNEVLGGLTPLARLLFQGLWCHADRAGRLEDRPHRIKQLVLPYDKCNVDSLLQLLHDTKDHDGESFICRYSVNGVRYIQIVKFSSHQNPHVRERESTIPAPCLNGASTELAPPHARALGTGDLGVGTGDLVMGGGYAHEAPPHAPDWEKVLEYATAIGHPSEAKRYFDARQAVGWHKNRQPIVDWMADLRGWCSNGFQHSVPLTEAARTPQEKQAAKTAEWTKDYEARTGKKAN